MWVKMMAAMILATDLDPIGLDGIVIRPSNNGKSHRLRAAQNKCIKGPNSIR